MKKNSTFIHNEQGFILPLTLFVAALLILFTGTNIAIYKNEMIITKNEIAQIKIDTLYQIGHTKFLAALDTLNQESGTTSYKLPDGEVSIEYQLQSSDTFKVKFSVNTLDNKLLVITDFISLPTQLHKP
ncbi:hypothetical protein VBD025_10745 [Virgibacillus flavescens]|uniref:hypothetical protein n=1 Tax=Virgibacillus flavescens TaxID=1611422 RepID=UPI003D33F106